MKTKTSRKKFTVPSIMIFQSRKSPTSKLKLHGGNLVYNKNETFLMSLRNCSKKILKS